MSGEPAAFEGRYVRVAQLVAFTGGIETDLAEIAIASTEELIDLHCRRRFDTVDPGVDQPVARIYGPGDSLDDVVAVSTVETRTSPTGAWTLLDADRWRLDPLNAVADGKPHTGLTMDTNGTAQVRVTGWFGWPAVPAVVTQAALIQASRLAQRRNAAFGIANIPSLEGAGMRLLSKLDADVELLLAGVRRHPVLVG